MQVQEVPEDPGKFSETKCLLVKNVLSDDARKLLATLLAVDEVGNLAATQVPGSTEIYNSLALMTVNQLLLDKLKKFTNLPNLVSTYAFYRKYFLGQDLAKHSDRPECEVSITISLADPEPEKDWLIYLQNPETKDIYAAHTKPGDGVIYMGCDLIHWREPCEKPWVKQFFSHYSTNTSLEFDVGKGKNNFDILMCQYIRSILELT